MWLICLKTRARRAAVLMIDSPGKLSNAARFSVVQSPSATTHESRSGQPGWNTGPTRREKPISRPRDGDRFGSKSTSATMRPHAGPSFDTRESKCCCAVEDRRQPTCSNPGRMCSGPGTRKQTRIAPLIRARGSPSTHIRMPPKPDPSRLVRRNIGPSNRGPFRSNCLRGRRFVSSPSPGLTCPQVGASSSR